MAGNSNRANVTRWIDDEQPLIHRQVDLIHREAVPGSGGWRSLARLGLTLSLTSPYRMSVTRMSTGAARPRESTTVEGRCQPKPRLGRGLAPGSSVRSASPYFDRCDSPVRATIKARTSPNR